MGVALKQAIVVVNEFTTKITPRQAKSNIKSGTRGGTPGDYVLRYMARELATEPITPIRYSPAQDFIMRYMARDSAVEKLPESKTELKHQFRNAQGQGGVAFGYGELSLSHQELKSAAKDIQRLFDKGHTVMKTVISFDQEYLKEMGVVPQDFQVTKRGDYRGQIDQMKLRVAISQGLDRLARRYFDDLRYVGVIQVDTEHVHCHLEMVDAGPGKRLTKGGQQKGKLSLPMMTTLKRGIDDYLDSKQQVKHLSSMVGMERRNVVSYVKRWAHDQVLRESLPQFLLSTLPSDRRLWRASSNDPSMQKAHRVVKLVVDDILKQKDSPLSDAMDSVKAYADQRRKKERLNKREWQKLVDYGEQKIYDQAMNAVYSVLRGLPDDYLVIRTPMLDLMGMDYDALLSKLNEDRDNDLLNFSFRLRSYVTRMNYHVEMRQSYSNLMKYWEDELAIDLKTERSRALYEFYKEEEDYHGKCVAKYQHFLGFTPHESTWYSGFEKVSQYGERIISLASMMKDDSLRKMADPDEAEELGYKVYGQRGAKHLSKNAEALGYGNKEVLEDRLIQMRKRYLDMIADLRKQLVAQGLVLTLERDGLNEDEDPERQIFKVGGNGRALDLTNQELDMVIDRLRSDRRGVNIKPGIEYAFEDVKGLDLHKLRFDFSTDVPIGKRAYQQFTEQATKRGEALKNAMIYALSSNQPNAIDGKVVKDIQQMLIMSNQLSQQEEPILSSDMMKLVRMQEYKRSATVRLGEGLTSEIINELSKSMNDDVLERIEDDLSTVEVSSLDESTDYDYEM